MRLRPRRSHVIGALAVTTFVAALALVAMGEGPPVPVGAADGDRDLPNFVVVMTDDQAIRDIEVMSETRRLIGDEGVTFTNSLVSFPLCCPSRASFLTGQHPHNHGVVSNQPPHGGFEGFDDRRTLPVALAREGYATGLFGKYLNGSGVHSRDDPGFVPPGWTRWHSIAERGYFDYTLIENGELREYGDRPRDYQTDVFARKVTGFIERTASRGRPFFAFVPTLAAHTERDGFGDAEPNPRPAPRHAGALADRSFDRPPNHNPRDVGDKPSFVRGQERWGRGRMRAIRRHDRDRARSLLAVDEMVEAIVKQLRESGQLANTYIIFTSDHGFAHGEHRRRGKQDLYEESIRVPLLIRGPGLPGGATIDAPAMNVDLAPTILAIAGIEPLRTMDGVDLRELVEDPDAFADRAIPLANSYAEGVRTAGRLYAEHGTDRGTEYELYDLDQDPFQLRNLLDTDSGELREPDPTRRQELEALRSALAELRDCAGIEGASSCDVRVPLPGRGSGGGG